MAPASKSKVKSKEKSSAKAPKEQQKASSKNTGNGSPSSAYNPLSGTFHTLETAPPDSSQPHQNNGRFQSIDENDEQHSISSPGTILEYDWVSNNGSCSGESEDTKEKATTTTTTTTTLRQESIPGSENDKREKIRLKNEKKHQRQRERRTQELHDKCSGYLMSRKLEALSQQIMGMGFSSDQATLALMVNDGRIEESISWILERNEEGSRNNDIPNGNVGNLKIDISEELARIAELELNYHCSKQEVERAVVLSEGDLDKAEASLRAQKQELPKVVEMPVETKTLLRPQEKPTIPSTQPRRNEYAKILPPIAVSPTVYPELVNRSMQPLKVNQTKVPVEKRLPPQGSTPSVSLQATPPIRLPLSKVEPPQPQAQARHIPQVALRDPPVVVMQRPQSMKQNQNQNQIQNQNQNQNHLVSTISSSPPGPAGWFPNKILGAETMKPNGKFVHDSSSWESLISQQYYHQQQAQFPQQSFMPGPTDPALAGVAGSWNGVASAPPSPSLAVPASLGLFSGWETLGSSYHTDSNTNPQFDYSSIDWSMKSHHKESKMSSGMWMGLSSLLKKSSSGVRLSGSNGSSGMMMDNGGVGSESNSNSSGIAAREWTSPFAGSDIFSVPRQFVTSPSP